MEASGTPSKAVKTQSAILLHCAGPEAFEVFDQLEFEDENEKKCSKASISKARAVL